MEILSTPTAELSTINRGTGTKEAGYLLMESIILMILEWFVVEWSEGQSRECAEMMYDEYYFLQIAELKHFVMKVKSGHYDESYLKNKISPTALLDWVGQYAGESLRVRSENYTMDAYSASADARAEDTVRKWQKDDAEPDIKLQVERIKQKMQERQSKPDAA